METNFFGVVQTTTAFLPLLRKSDCPVILNVSSGLGSNTYQSRPGANWHNFVAYSSSKAALNSYTIAPAHELKAEGVRVNAVTPGITATKLNNYVAGGASAKEGAESLLPWVLIGKEGPTGKFFASNGEEFPW